MGGPGRHAAGQKDVDVLVLERGPDPSADSFPKPAGLAAAVACKPEPSAPSATITPHFDPASEVVLQIECLSTRAVKTIVFLVHAVVAVSLAVLLVVIITQTTTPPDHFFTNPGLMIANTVVASGLLLVSIVSFGRFVWRVHRSSASKKHWTHRRRRLAMMAGIEVGLQFFNSLWFLFPNSYVLANECSWFSPAVVWSAFLRWTIWNTTFLIYLVESHTWCPAPPNTHWYVQRGEERGCPVVLDAPLWMHWRKGILWAATEAVLLGLLILTFPRLRNINDAIAANPAGCNDANYSCATFVGIIVLLACSTVCIAAYAFTYAFYIRHAFQHLLRQPYNQYRQANHIIRVQMRQRAMSIAFFFLCQIFYTFVGFATCRSYVLTWLGYMPSMLVMVLVGCVNAYGMAPTRPNEDSILEVWLQEFAWTEGEEEERKREERVSSLLPHSFNSEAVAREPMFCFETALKAMYWSFLVYDHEEVADSPYSVGDALALYDQAEFEVHWDRHMTDTKVALGCSSDTVVIAFRGTASMANVKSDVQVWRTAWPPGHGSQFLCSTPMVHLGFHKAWTSQGLHERILAWLHTRVAARAETPGPKIPLKVLVTGHSLGGALATLCAFDIANQFAEAAVQVKCYTFGAPRTGNHAFARLYNKAVPDTWQMINSDDVVTRAGKFWVLYKRAGHRVLLNKLGDLVVRPSYVETTIRHVPGATSVRDHLLTSYQAAFAAVLGVQFSSKRFEAGQEGVLRLARRRGGVVVLDMVGLAHGTLAMLQEHGWDTFLQVRRRSKRTGKLLPPWVRRRLAAGDSRGSQEGGEEGSGSLAAADAAAGGNPDPPAATAGGSPQARASPRAGQPLARASLGAAPPLGPPSALERSLTTRGTVEASLLPLEMVAAAKEAGKEELDV